MAIRSRLGSSPLTRGAPVSCAPTIRPLGLIPAHAGSTWKTWKWTSGTRAHPRSRGEHNISRILSDAGLGSSPLTRGALNCFIEKAGECGLIPAHAGSTGGTCPLYRPTRAHPRSRGEHEHLEQALRALQGSSPLTRGAPR